jgi:hypothetical protein
MSRDLIAKRKVYYAKREYAAGERFTAQTDRDVEALILVGAAEFAEAMQAAASPEPPMRRGPGRPRKYPIEEQPHTYRRRDLVAED